MNLSTIILIVVVVAGLAIVVYNHYHKKHIRYHVEHLRDAVTKIFADSKVGQMGRQDFLLALQHSFNCSRKETYYLYGKAREAGFIRADEKTVEKRV